MQRKVLSSIIGAILIFGGIPASIVWAHGHGPDHSGPPSHSLNLPSQASQSGSGSGSTPPSGSAVPSNPGRGHSNPTRSTRHGPPKEVAQIRQLQAQVRTARQQYVAAVQAYLKALSAALSSGQASQLKIALAQLKTINVTLAQTVKTEMAAQSAKSGGHGLTQVVTMFQLELKALETSTSQVQGMTQKLTVSTSPSTTASGSTSPSASPSPTTTSASQ